MSPDVNNPAYRALSYDELAASYQQQMEAMLEGGVDAILIETIFDTLNAKAAIFAAEQAMKATGVEVPVMLSVTVSDIGGRTLSGQTLDAFLASVQHANIFSVGLNCSFGARQLKPFLEQLAARAPYYISAYPNAGLPNSLGKYDQTPADMAHEVREYIEEGLINIIGGCCGTTDAYIAEYPALVKGAKPHVPALAPDCMWLSGLELLEVKPEINFVNVGERCNVAGSRKFLRLINEKKYDEALSIARQQVEDGALVIDVNMDDGLLDAKTEMTTFLNLIMSEPEIARVPVMIDSSKWEVIEAGLKCLQGKSIVNSISLKEGEEVFLEHARIIRQYGAAAVVMAFDEKGQADTAARKIEVCERAYRLLVDKVGFNPHDIIFDPNVLAVATGIEEHNNYAVDFIEADVDEADIGGVVEGQRASFTVDAYPNDVFEGVVTQIRLGDASSTSSTSSTTTVVTYEVVISAPNPDLKLKPRLTANVTIYILDKKDVLSVPNKALRFTPEKPLIGNNDIVKDCEGEHKLWTREGTTFIAHPVEVGISNGISTEIISGIPEGTKVVTEATIGVMPGENMGPEGNMENGGERSPFMPGPPGSKKKK